MRMQEGTFAIVLLFAFVGCDRTENDWSKAEAANTGSAFATFLLRHPQGPHADEAEIAIDDLEWAAANAANSDESYQSYLKEHQQGRHAVEATAGIEGLVWVRANSTRSLDGYGEYLREYPRGRHAQDAMSAVDDLQWDLARRAGTVVSCESFIDDHWNSKHVVDALDLKADLDVRDKLTDGETGSSQVVGQCVAYLLDTGGNRGKGIPIMMVEGYPIVLGQELSARRDVELGDEMEIKVVTSKGWALLVDPKCIVPVFMSNDGPVAATTFGNVTWVFPKRGMSFSTKTKHYLIEKPGATIRFSKGGITTDGVRIVPRCVPTSLPATMRSGS